MAFILRWSEASGAKSETLSSVNEALAKAQVIGVEGTTAIGAGDTMATTEIGMAGATAGTAGTIIGADMDAAVITTIDTIMATMAGTTLGHGSQQEPSWELPAPTIIAVIMINRIIAAMHMFGGV